MCSAIEEHAHNCDGHLGFRTDEQTNHGLAGWNIGRCSLGNKCTFNAGRPCGRRFVYSSSPLNSNGWRQMWWHGNYIVDYEVNDTMCQMLWLTSAHVESTLTKLENMSFTLPPKE